MDTVLQRTGSAFLVLVSGRITIDSSPDLRTLLLHHLQTSGCEALTVDLCGVSYIDTSGLAILLELLRAARGLRRGFHLRRLSEGPRYLLEQTRLLHLFHEVTQ